jgi:phosphocarrier protein FPr
MIATLDEWRLVRAVVEEEAANLDVKPVPLGIMVEVPSVAMMAEQFAREVDFFSIGTNDLAQFTLAMDRDHPRLASRVDALHPAVLRLIAQTTEGAQKHGRWVGVCGGMAGDPQAVPILMGLGVKELSVAVPSLPTIKALVRSLSYEEAQKKARQALTLESAAEVRALYPLEDYEL